VNIRFGLDTFGDMTLKDDGTPETAGQVLRNVVEEAVLAEQVGLDNFNIGEHHRDDFAVTAPDTVLAGIATKTTKITLGSGVTVLSSEDPIRVYQRFATLDGLSNGRAEITAGRGSFKCDSRCQAKCQSGISNYWGRSCKVLSLREVVSRADGALW